MENFDGSRSPTVGSKFSLFSFIFVRHFCIFFVFVNQALRTIYELVQHYWNTISSAHRFIRLCVYRHDGHPAWMLHAVKRKIPQDLLPGTHTATRSCWSTSWKQNEEQKYSSRFISDHFFALPLSPPVFTLALFPAVDLSKDALGTPIIAWIPILVDRSPSSSEKKMYRFLRELRVEIFTPIYTRCC